MVVQRTTTMSNGVLETTFVTNSPADDFHYIAVDVETSGSTSVDMLLAVGVGIVRQSDARPVSSLLVVLSSMIYYRNDGVRPKPWCETTWREFWNNAAKRSDGRTPIDALANVSDKIGFATDSEAAAKIVTFLRAAMRAVNDWVVTSDNVAFDAGWIDRLLREHNHPPLAELSGRHRSLFDYSNFNAGVARAAPSLRLAKSYTLACDALGVPSDERTLAFVEHDHVPDHDALVGAHRAAVVARAIVLKMVVPTAPPSSSMVKRKAGDWDCRKCLFMNFASRVECFKCGSAQKDTEKAFDVPYGLASVNEMIAKSIEEETVDGE